MSFYLCVYQANNNFQLGILENKKNNHKRLDLNHQSISKATPVYKWQINDSTILEQYQQYINDKKKLLTKLGLEISPNKIYEVCKKDVAYQLSDICELLNIENDCWHEAFILLTIFKNNKLFWTNKGLVTARSPKKIAIIQRSMQNTQLNAHRELQIEKKIWVKDLLANRSPSISNQYKNDYQQFLKDIHELAVESDFKINNSPLQSLLQPYQKFAFNNRALLAKILINAGINQSWGKLLLAQTENYQPFNQEEINQANSIVKMANKSTADIIDETHLDTYSVDELGTKDIDDAISISNDQQNIFIRLHIAAAADFIHQNSPLFLCSNQRALSIYTPKGVCPMLPFAISENRLSLIADAQRNVITVCWQLNYNYQIISCKIYRSLITVNKNYHYQQLEEILDKDLWPYAEEFTKIYRNQRLQKGANLVKHNQISIDAQDPKNIKIYHRKDTRASMLIQELAIQANIALAEFLQTHANAALYRAQSKPLKKMINGQEKLIKCAAKYSLQPLAHASLGTMHYALSTSPLRRFSDLVNQTIITAILDGKNNPFTEYQLLDFITQIQINNKLYQDIEQQLTDHWKYRFLEQNADQPYKYRIIKQINEQKIIIEIAAVKLKIVVDRMLIETNRQEILIKTVNPATRTINFA